jgi:hypothetical protein
LGWGRRGWFWVLNRTVNPVALWTARARVGPVAIVRHVGRCSGKHYETPLLLARVDGGFVAELTYGDRADWYRNAVEAGGCTVVLRGVSYTIGSIERYPYRDGVRAFGVVAEFALRALRREEFRLLRIAAE